MLIKESTVKLDLPADLHGEDQWVEIKAQLTAADMATLEQRAIKLGFEWQEAPITSSVVLVELCLKGWSLEDEATSENIGRLPIATINWLAAEINRLNPARTESGTRNLSRRQRRTLQRSKS